MKEEDEGFAPRAVWLGGIVILFGFFAASLIFSIAKPRAPLQPPYDRYLGCYSTPDGPKIFFDRARVKIYQESPIELSSKLEYVKGWKFNISRALRFVELPDGIIRVTLGNENGEYLSLSREGEISDSHPGFDLIDANSLTTIQYLRSGTTCAN